MVRPILCKDKKLSNRPPLLIPSGGGFFEVAIVPYVSRIRPVCLIPLSILHRSHLVLNHKGTIITHPEHHNRVHAGYMQGFSVHSR